jgi:hypothetical protein
MTWKIIARTLAAFLLVAFSMDGQNVSRMNSGISTQTGTNYAIVCSDSLKLLQLNNASAQTPTLVAASTCGAGVVFQIQNIGAGTQTITPTTSNISYFNGLTYTSAAATLPLANGQGAEIYNDGTNYYAFIRTIGNTIRSIVFIFGDSTTGPTLTTGEIGYVTMPFACTITGWHMMADGTNPTATIDVLKISAGTTLPTASIAAAALPAISTGNAINSTSVGTWTTSVAVNDIIGFQITAVTVAKQITIQLDCAQ